MSEPIGPSATLPDRVVTFDANNRLQGMAGEDVKLMGVTGLQTQ